MNAFIEARCPQGHEDIMNKLLEFSKTLDKDLVANDGASLDAINATASLMTAMLTPFIEGCCQDRDRLMTVCAPALFQLHDYLRHLHLPIEERERIIPW